jgi:hypothetical protein
MSTQTEGNYSAKWSLYANPELFRIGAEAEEKGWQGWVRVTLETDPEDIEVAVTDEIEQVDAEPESGELKFHRLSLKLRLEEIPRLVAVLNEVYLNNHQEAVQTLEFDQTEEWGERRVKS